MQNKAALLLIFVGIILSFMWVLFLRPQEKFHVGEDGPIIFFGDSLVEGIGATPGNDLPAQLSRQISQSVINAGRSGDTTASALARLEQDVISRDPGLVIILLGGNDFIKQIPLDETFKNFSIMIDRIKTHGAGVLLIGIRGGIFGDPFKERFEQLAKEKGIVFIPNILDGVIGNPELMSDPIHPNDDGYAKMAKRVAPVVLKLIR